MSSNFGEEARLMEARALLAEVTPLVADCGALCGHLCCRDSEDGMNGMLLFPGEEWLALPEGAEVLPTAYMLEGGPALLMTCPGRCDRSKRPLSCRIFPLMYWPRKQGDFTLRMDERARFCPLHDSGTIGLAKGFQDAVREALALLLPLPRQAEFLRMLAEEQRELRALAKGFGLD